MSVRDVLHQARAKVFNPYAAYVRMLQSIPRLPKEYAHVATPCQPSENSLDIVTVAFNVPEIIAKQIEMVQKYVTDTNYTHIIADNSTDLKARIKIEEICKTGGVKYVPVPAIIDKLISSRLFNFGLSHGAALNWTLSNVIAQRQPTYLALLDHDLFPISRYGIVAQLGDHDFYGVSRIREKGWYLWPGFSVFKYAVLRQNHACFLPCSYHGEYLDAGGSNYERIYSHYDLLSQRFAQVETTRVQVTPGLTSPNDIYHADCAQRIDKAWIHLINGSNYAHLEGKEKMVMMGLKKFQ